MRALVNWIEEPRFETGGDGHARFGWEALLDRLERGDVLVVDGGTGSELHRRSPKKISSDPPDLFTNPDPPSTFARAAGEWLDAGAQLVGGCCGTGPEHIRAIRHAVDTHSSPHAVTAS